MTMKLVTAMVAAGFLFASTGAQAHCDSVDGPVAKAALAGLENGNVHPVLAYAPPSAEDEIRSTTLACDVAYSGPRDVKLGRSGAPAAQE